MSLDAVLTRISELTPQAVAPAQLDVPAAAPSSAPPATFDSVLRGKLQPLGARSR